MSGAKSMSSSDKAQAKFIVVEQSAGGLRGMRSGVVEPSVGRCKFEDSRDQGFMKGVLGD